MGRDDAKPVRGLQGGRAPATAFAAFMSQAVANRPVEKFETGVTLPEWLLESDEEAYLGDAANMTGDAAATSADPSQSTPDEEAEYRRIIDEATRRDAQPVRPNAAMRRDTQPSRPNQ